MQNRDQPTVWSEPAPRDLREYPERGYDRTSDFYPIHHIERARDEAYALRDGYRGNEVAYEKDGTTVRLIGGIQYVEPRLVDLLITPKLITLAESILGSAVYLHQFRLHYKPGFMGGDFFWHSDFSIWRWEDGMMDPRCVTFVVPLEEMRYENGPIMVSPRTHLFRDDIDWHRMIRDGRETYREGDKDVSGRCRCTEEQVKLVETNGATSIIGCPGDVCWFDVNTMHTSAPNLSPWSRLTAFISINSMCNKLQNPLNGKPARPNWISSRDYNQL